jgi:hypothetical protein
MCRPGIYVAMLDAPVGREPTSRQVEAAAKAWMTWQFPGRSWDDAVPELKDKFRDGARHALIAAASVPDTND